MTETEKNFLELILADPGREFPPEVVAVIKGMLNEDVPLSSADFPDLVKSLLKSEDDGSGEYKIGGCVRR